MPAAIPLAIAGATLVANNVAQKSAIKNNENQQTAAVNNAKQSADEAFQRQQQYLHNNPAPFAQFNIARPAGFAPQATISGMQANPQRIMGGAFNGTPMQAPSPMQTQQPAQPPHAGQPGGFNPAMLGNIGALIQAMGGHGSPSMGASPLGMVGRVMSGFGAQQQPGMVSTQPRPAGF